MTKIVKIKPMKSLTFVDLLGIQENLQNMIIFHGDKYLSDAKTIEEVKNRLDMFTCLVLESASILTTFRIKDIRYVCIFDKKNGIFDYRDINDLAIVNTSFFAYFGIGFILFTSGELHNVFRQKKEFAAAKNKAKERDIDIQIVVVFAEDEPIDTHYYRGMLKALFSASIVLFVTESEIQCSELPTLRSMQHASI